MEELENNFKLQELYSTRQIQAIIELLQGDGRFRGIVVDLLMSRGITTMNAATIPAEGQMGRLGYMQNIVVLELK